MDFTLGKASFLSGTSVGAYPKSNWTGPGQPSGAPQGAATATASAASDGSVAFTGLADNTEYWAAENTSTTRYIGFRTGNATSDLATDVDVLSLSPGTGASALGKAEDAVHASGDVGVMSLAVRKDTAVALGVDGDYAPLLTDSVGRLHTNAAGAAASGAAVAGNPVLVAGSDGTNARSVKVSSAGVVNVSQGAAAAADVLNGYLLHTATNAAATILTIPAGRTWKGTLSVRATGSKSAAATGAGQAIGVVATAGANVVPAAATVLDAAAFVAANATAGTTGTQGSNATSIPLTVIAPVGNAVTLTLASTITNLTEGSVAAAASGELI